MQTTYQFLIPFYKEFSYLERCLESVINQTVTDWKAVVIDDQEEDNDFCRNVIGKLADNRISLVRKKKRGSISDSWNYALQQAKPGLLSIFHADDELDPHYVECMLDFAIRFPESAAFFTQAVTIDENSRRRFSCIDFAKKLIDLNYSFGRVLKLEGERGLTKILCGNLVFCPSVCYVNREGLRLEFKPYRQVLDFDMFASMLLDGGKIIGIPRKLIFYRRHSGNFSLQNNQSDIRFEEERNLYEELAVRSERKGWTKAAKVARRKFIVYAHHYFTNTRSLFRIKRSSKPL